ncbi:PREDICTED: endoplasmic reticulum metallopeptidase 1-like [Rhagoletis zephyria]|uniref:endoplasmic reticulum metallopeptidase 1-like n=2 Tax=Rhagoletis TaxID=28609 RepID=UPI0008116C3A|nr:PREDICTED: endoplasmic reticulum metallopeptidase 1-like [Rhagoletis zephyria]
MADEDVKKAAPDEEQVPTEPVTSKKKKSSKVGWILAPAFLIIWPAILYAIVIPLFLSLPEGITIASESSYPGQFIAERAENILYDFNHIGPKVVGSDANENHTVELLKNELEKIRSVMQEDLFELDVDVQVVSGAYMHWQMVNMYQAVQNVVVRIRSKNSTSEAALLMNSHFDSKPGSPGAGDDGTMVVILLETLRVLATTRQTFKHPIVFLFNGAEENPLQASHGFVTQHEWAKNCKAVINLDSAGSGGREILFQAGPNHPWLMKIYHRNAKRSFATTFAEELFQSGIIPSDTDFRIFKNFGDIPGLDIAHFKNGYVYHTKFDRIDVIPRGTLQSTGDNILALARAFSNSTELKDPENHASGHAIFYDFLGLFVIEYTEDTGKIINTAVVVVALVLVAISLWCIAEDSFISICSVFKLFSLIFILHLVGWILALALPLLVAVALDSAASSMTWFTNKWLVLGLYACPALFGLSVPTLLYLSISRNDKVSHPYRLQLVYHAHTLILSVACIALTYVGIRSSYFLMISLIFQDIALIINFVTTLYRRAYYWSIFVTLSQIIPFLYFTSLYNALLTALVPMMGRFGTSTNPDLIIALLTTLGTLLAMGYLIPLLNIFRRPKLVLLILPTVTIVFGALTLTLIGFPYRPQTNVERVHVLQVQRVFYDYDGSVSLNDSGYYFDFQDRRKNLPLESYVDLEDLYYVSKNCSTYMFCGVPVFNHRFQKAVKYAAWLPREEPIELPGRANLTLISKTANASDESVRFEFELQGPPHMSIFVQPIDDVVVSSWSFLEEMLQNKATYQPPYHIYFSYGKENTPLSFYIDLKKDDSDFDEPLMQLGISGHFVSGEWERDAETKKFLAELPPYTYAEEWPTSYDVYTF